MTETADEREAELRRVPLQKIDKRKWPANVRPIGMGEADGLGIDDNGRLHWDGKPVEIVGQRLDLTWTQTIIAVLVAIFTAVAAFATSVQAWTAYHDWACKVGWPVYAHCPAVQPLPDEFLRATSKIGVHF
jgi:hypothetical protein